jgi:hypothetical protein
VLELGLGNGRTYDHLREALPERDIFVFDRQVRAHPASIPPPDRLFLGELADTLPAAVLPAPAVLVHSDIGSGDTALNADLARLIATHLPRLLAPQALVIADQEMPAEGWQRLPEPAGIAPGRYFLYRTP